MSACSVVYSDDRRSMAGGQQRAKDTRGMHGGDDERTDSVTYAHQPVLQALDSLLEVAWYLGSVCGAWFIHNVLAQLVSFGHRLVALSCESLGEGRTSMRDSLHDGHGNFNDVHLWSLLYGGGAPRRQGVQDRGAVPRVL